MSLEVIKVENLKCGGCAATIRKRLLAIPGVKEVQVALDKAAVIVEYDLENLNDQILEVLAALGYPKKGTGTRLQKMKSYISCMVGKVQNQGH